MTFFERRQSRIKLTSLGEQIVHQAQRVLEEADRIKILVRLKARINRWRRSFTRPQIIDVIRNAVYTLKIPGLTTVAN